MAIPTVQDVITALVGVAKTVPFPTTGAPPRVRDLNDTPMSIEQGDCPQVIFLPTHNKSSRLTFDNSANVHASRRDVTVLIYYFDTIETEVPWTSRPRTVQWTDAMVAALDASDGLGIPNGYFEVTADVRDGMKFNNINFRGAVITLTGFWFDC